MIGGGLAKSPYSDTELLKKHRQGVQMVLDARLVGNAADELVIAEHMTCWFRAACEDTQFGSLAGLLQGFWTISKRRVYEKKRKRDARKMA